MKSNHTLWKNPNICILKTILNVCALEAFLYLTYKVKCVQSAFTPHVTFIHSHTHIPTMMTGATTRVANLRRLKLTIHTHSFTNGTAIGSNSRSSILPKDKTTCGLKDPGIKLPISEQPLNLLNHNHV